MKISSILQEFLKNSFYKGGELKKIKAVTHSYENPISGQDSYSVTTICTKWPNGEGIDISINTYNSYTKKSEDKKYSFHTEDINSILLCMTKLGFFDE
jgi:hypothetical protein